MLAELKPKLIQVKGNRMIKGMEKRKYICYYPVNLKNAEIKALACL